MTGKKWEPYRLHHQTLLLACFRLSERQHSQLMFFLILALLFAEIGAEAGLPPGVFNVITGDGRMGSMLATHPTVDKVGFTGSTSVSNLK